MELHIVNIPPLEVQHGEGFIRAQGYQMKEWEETEVKRSWEEIHAGLHMTNSLFARLSGSKIARYDLEEQMRNELKHFFANRNYLSYFPFHSFERALTLDLSNTQIHEIPVLPPQLRILAISNTMVSQLPNLPASLRILKAANARLRELPEIPSGMLKISVRNNRLRTLPFESIQQCRRLLELRYEGNPFDDIFPESFLRWLEFQFQRVERNGQDERNINRFRIERKGGIRAQVNRIDEAYYDLIYDDDAPDGIKEATRIKPKPVIKTITSSGQNVHDRKILNNLTNAYAILSNETDFLQWNDSNEFAHGMTGMEILYNLWILLKEELEKKDIILMDKDENLWERLWKDNNLETSGIMNEDGSFHSEITMALTMGYVFGWYVKNHPIEKWKDIMEILAGEWIEWRIVCMTGRLMRCVNLLSGIHPEFKVEVPIGEQIQQKYNYLYKRYAHRFPEEGWLENPERILRYYNESIFLWKDFASHFREALEEINVNEEVIQEWILPLEENAKDLEDEMKEKYPDEYNKLLEKWETDKENAFYSQRDYEHKTCKMRE